MAAPLFSLDHAPTNDPTEGRAANHIFLNGGVDIIKGDPYIELNIYLLFVIDLSGLLLESGPRKR